MHRVYFDRNVFSALTELENGITTDDVEKVKHVVRTGAIKVLGSFPLFEETVTTFGRSEEMYSRHMATVLDIVDHRRMVKPVDRLIQKDCYDYAVGLAQNDRSMSIPVWLREFLDFPKDREKSLRTLVEDIKQYRGRSAANMTEGLLAARAAGLIRRAGEPKDFNQLWEGLADVAVKFWVDKCPQEIRQKCYKRGLRRMLRVKSIRFFALYYLSTMHTAGLAFKGNLER